jgi:3-oxoacyl-[acyl-carrier protein] reductase
MIDPGLHDKVVLVTGGNNPCGIGAAVARAFSDQGAAVFIHYFRPKTEPATEAADETVGPDTPGLPFFYAMQTRSADDVVEEITEKGGLADSWEADLSDPDVVAELFDRAERVIGSIDILVNNAADYEADTFLPESNSGGGEGAIWEEGPVTSTVTAESCDRHFGVNTRAPVLMMAEYVRRYVRSEKEWGRIINVSADCAEGCPSEISYRASKYALESYSRSAAAELGPLGITVNIVSPGPIQTGYISPQIEQELITDIPLGRVGRPEDVADIILMLASEQAGWITGQILWVHGGHRMAP